MSIKTTDLCDQYASRIQVAEPIFNDYGGARTFGGKIATVKVHEDNILVHQALQEPGAGRVLVVDGGGSLRCAVVGGGLAEMAHKNGWAGILVYGCVRDSDELAQVQVAVKALGTNPLRPAKRGAGQRDLPVKFAGVTFTPGHYLYADVDGVIVSEDELA
jgi:regulator of ribonuclease activity A